MPNDFYDLVVLVENQTESLGLDGYIFVYGVITGLNLGEARIAAGRGMEDCVLEALTSPEMGIVGILEKANKYMPEGKPFTRTMFFEPDYVIGYGAKDYREGLKIGFRYVMELGVALKDKKIFERHLYAVREEILKSV